MTALTTTWDQQTRYLRQQSLNSNPRQQFDIDTQNLLWSWIDMYIRIILCIDANDNLLEGTFLDTMNTLGLINAHSAYCNSPLPPTHERGSHPISGIFISPTLVPTRAGMLRHGVGILGDHRNMFVDFHEYNVLGDEIYTIPPPKMRRLQLYDSRIVNKFNKICENHFKHNNIPNQLLELNSQAECPPPPHVAQKMQIMDEQIGRAIASGALTQLNITQLKIQYVFGPYLSKNNLANAFRTPLSVA